MRKPIKSPLYFEARFRIRGKVLLSSMCPHCEREGELGLRVARDPERGLAYDIKDRSTFVDIIAFDPKGSYMMLKPGDLVEADIVCFGYLRRVRAAGIEIEGNVLASGSRKVGRASIDDGRLVVDFSIFKATLAAETQEEMQRVLKRLRIKHGTLLETDCSVDIEVRGVGRQENDLRRKGPRRRVRG